MPSLDSRSFRRWFGGFATGIAVVTAKNHKGAPVGITINSVTSVSLEPPLALFCLVKSAQLYPAFRKATHFTVNVLGEDQEYLSRYFADPHRNAVPENIWGRSQNNCPILRHTLGWMVCEKIAVHAGGDHDIFLGKAVKLHRRSGNGKPLLYFRGRYRKIGD